jgi:protease I
MARIAFILDDTFEDSEFRIPYDRLTQAGLDCVVVASEGKKQVKGKKGEEVVTPDRHVGEVSSDEFDALVIPGGYSPDRLRMDPAMVRFTREFFDSGKTLAAVCHGPWMLAEADVLSGRTVTSWPSIRTDLVNAGAEWVDREVVEDGNLITSRKPADLAAFSDAIQRHLSSEIIDRTGMHDSRGARSEEHPTIKGFTT